MMRIRYKPQHECKYGDHLISGLRWHYNEVKDIPDNQQVRIRRNGQSVYYNLVDLLLSDPSYQEAETGKNPLYPCDYCGEQTLAEYYRHPKSGEYVENDFDGMRICEKCYQQAQDDGRIVIHPDSIELLED